MYQLTSTHFRFGSARAHTHTHTRERAGRDTLSVDRDRERERDVLHWYAYLPCFCRFANWISNAKLRSASAFLSGCACCCRVASSCSRRVKHCSSFAFITANHTGARENKYFNRQIRWGRICIHQSYFWANKLKTTSQITRVLVVSPWSGYWHCAVSITFLEAMATAQCE